MEYLTKINEISEQARQEFSSLTIDQLNWKPHPDKWSIGQCLDHIITTNSTYLQVFESIINRKYKSDLVESAESFLRLFWKLPDKNFRPGAKKSLPISRSFQTFSIRNYPRYNLAFY
jgi:hypothetical protein